MKWAIISLHQRVRFHQVHALVNALLPLKQGRVSSLPSGQLSLHRPHANSTVPLTIWWTSSLNCKKMLLFSLFFIACEMNQLAQERQSIQSMQSGTRTVLGLECILMGRKGKKGSVYNNIFTWVSCSLPFNSCYCYFLAEPEICPSTYFTSRGEDRWMVCIMLKTFHLLSRKSSFLTQESVNLFKAAVQVLCPSGPWEHWVTKPSIQMMQYLYLDTLPEDSRRKVRKTSGRLNALFSSGLVTLIWIPAFWFTKLPWWFLTALLASLYQLHSSPGTDADIIFPLPLALAC